MIPTRREAHPRPVLAAWARPCAEPHHETDQNGDRRCRRRQRFHRRHGGEGAPGVVRRFEGADTGPGAHDDDPGHDPGPNPDDDPDDEPDDEPRRARHHDPDDRPTHPDPPADDHHDPAGRDVRRDVALAILGAAAP